MQQINVDEIMHNIRQEVEKRKRSTGESTTTKPTRYPDGSPPHLSLPRFSKESSFQFKEEYTLNDFLQYHDEDFVRNTYQGILKREPDPHGFNHYLTKLRSGIFNKTVILGRIRYSKEGRLKNTSVTGLFLPFVSNLAYDIPILGYVLRCLTGLIRIPVILRNLNEYEAFTNTRFSQGTKDLDAALFQIEENLNQLSSAIRSAAQNQRLEELHRQVTDLKSIVTGIDGAYRQSMEGFKQQQAVFQGSLKEMDIVYGRRIDELKGMHAALQSSVKDNEAHHQETMEALGHEISKFKSMMAEEFKKTISDLAIHKADNEKVDGLTNSLGKEINDAQKELRNHKMNILDQQRRLAILLEETRKRFPEPLSDEQLGNILNEEDHLLDAFFVSFEDLFRGTREDIKERQRVYLPYLERARVRAEDSPIIDVGCGRGEWLELLKENGYSARGIDANRVMIRQCQELGLEVIEGNGIACLRKEKPNSIGVVTGFHLIEHLSLKSLVALLDETLRVLKPNGVLILETPNPENVLVGSCNFYMDPTHTKPLPSDMLRFLAEARGFCNVDILKLHALQGSARIDASCLSEYFNGPRDYALIAYKV